MMYVGAISVLAWVLIGLVMGLFIGAILMYHHVVTYGDDETNDQIHRLREARRKLEAARLEHTLLKLLHINAKIHVVVNKHSSKE